MTPGTDSVNRLMSEGNKFHASESSSNGNKVLNRTQQLITAREKYILQFVRIVHGVCVVASIVTQFHKGGSCLNHDCFLNFIASFRYSTTIILLHLNATFPTIKQLKCANFYAHFLPIGIQLHL